MCGKNCLRGEPFRQISEDTGIEMKIKFDMLVISTGFEVASIDDNHYDNDHRKINNSSGCVIT